MNEIFTETFNRWMMQIIRGSWSRWVVGANYFPVRCDVFHHFLLEGSAVTQSEWGTMLGSMDSLVAWLTKPPKSPFYTVSHGELVF